MRRICPECGCDRGDVQPADRVMSKKSMEYGFVIDISEGKEWLRVLFPARHAALAWYREGELEFVSIGKGEVSYDTIEETKGVKNEHR